MIYIAPYTRLQELELAFLKAWYAHLEERTPFSDGNIGIGLMWVLELSHFNMRVMKFLTELV